MAGARIGPSPRKSLLITVGLGRDNGTLVRVLALLLAVLFAVLSMQLMAKQRFHEQVDTRYLQRWEHAADIVVAGLCAVRHGSAGQAGRAVEV